MKKQIGFIDYSLDNFHANTFLKLARGPLADRGWDVGACWAVQEEAGRGWARENNVPYVSAFDDLASCDGLMLLAPSNPELHLELIEPALDFGAPIFVDKPIAQNLETAETIFRKAGEHSVPVMSTSALRCAPALTAFLAKHKPHEVRHIRTWCGGGTFAEYAVHAVEMAVSAMGEDVVHIAHSQCPDQHIIHVEFSEGRTATIFFHPHIATPYQAMATTSEATHYIDCTGAGMFEGLGRLVFDFFESRSELVPHRETLLIRRILDSCAQTNIGHPFGSSMSSAASRQ